MRVCASRFNFRLALALIAWAMLIPLGGVFAAGESMLSSGQTVYVPVYSHIYFGDRAAEFNLAATLSIRNTDQANPISVTAVDYYDSEGRLVKKHLQQAVRLGPMASTEVYIPERDKSGGFGAAFIVQWICEKAVNPPLIQCVMIGASSGQGISFVSTGRVIAERSR
jgi:Protein of unknown function (DUF3124)